MNFLEQLKQFIMQYEAKELSKEQLQEAFKQKKAGPTKDLAYIYAGEFTKEIKKSAKAGEYLVIKGMASNAKVDRGGDIVIPEGLKTPSVINNRIPMLKQHEEDQILGSWYDWQVINGQFYVEGKLYKEYDPVAYQQVLNGDLNALSIAGRVLDWEWDDVNKVTILKELELLEVSVVTIGMHQEARIIAVEQGTEKSFGASLKKSIGGEGGEEAQPPVQPAADDANKPAGEEGQGEGGEIPGSKPEPQPEAPVPSVEEQLKARIQELETENSQLKEQVTEKAELETLLEQATEIIENQNVELEKKL